MRGSMRLKPNSNGMSDDERKTRREQLAKPLWDKLKPWLELERRRVVRDHRGAAT